MGLIQFRLNCLINILGFNIQTAMDLKNCIIQIIWLLKSIAKLEVIMASIKDWDKELDKMSQEEIKNILTAATTLFRWDFFKTQYSEFSLLARIIEGKLSEK